MIKIIKNDCYWYHCEHDMGASIDCCTLCDGLGECPCSDDCENYISNKEVTEQLKYRKDWRCWNKKPTDDQRKNTLWIKPTDDHRNDTPWIEGD